MVLCISAYSVRCLSSPFSIISRRFIIRARVDDDILDFSGLLIGLATLDALCWIMAVMVSLMVSMSSSSCSVSRIGFYIRVGIRYSLILFVRHLLLVASWLSMFFFSPLCPICGQI